MDRRTGRNRNFEEESSFGEKIMREFPYAEIFLLYLAVRLLWPPLSLPNNQEVQRPRPISKVGDGHHFLKSVLSGSKIYLVEMKMSLHDWLKNGWLQE